ncbi:MAG: sigma-54 dependent transcriptional regulator [Lentisphaerae bacterium]|nr:sigma-54 dependent transcriptional regulator [Lentisphaerota bacterium]
MSKRILIVDSERFARESIRDRMTREGFVVVESADGQSALARAGRELIDLAIIDFNLPDLDGMELLNRLCQVRPQLPILIITAQSSITAAVQAIKQGAYDYIAKPFDLDELAIQIRRILETSKLQSDLSVRIQADKERYGLNSLVGCSPPIRQITTMLRKVASSPTTILLRGESGTGKDLLARVIHYESDRADRLFMNVVCTAIPDQLLESELFGHERGAFTDAKRQRTGLFELAHGGTVFLDEIGDMSPALQAKLLHVLEYKSFRRIGGTEDIRVDVRILAATNRDLEAAIRKGAFREDLFYRISVMPLVLPPLRDRPEDVPLLAQYFRDRYAHEFRRDFRDFTPEALQKLLAYHWPGNVRELRNVVERALLIGNEPWVREEDILLGRGFLAPEEAPAGGAIHLPPEGCRLDDVEKDLVVQALERAAGNRTKAAKLLGITRDQVRYKVEKFGLPAPTEA